MHPTVILSIKKYTKSTTKYKISQKQNKSRILFCVGLLCMRPALKGICYIQFHSTEENDSPCHKNSQFQIGGDTVHTFLSVCWDLCLDWACACSMHDVSLWEFACGSALLCLEDAVFVESSTTYGSTLFLPPPLNTLSLEGMVWWIKTSHLGLSTTVFL